MLVDLNQVDILLVDVKQYRSACCPLMHGHCGSVVIRLRQVPFCLVLLCVRLPGSVVR